jgi:hypothetical protein
MTPSHARSVENPSDDAPDSARLRVSENTVHESGIPPARERLAREADFALKSLEQLELALVESTRAEAHIGVLLRGLAHLAASAGAAREANAALLGDLETLRETLGRFHEHESALAQRVDMLTHLLDATRREAEREREQWIAQEDAFLVELITDYEDKLDQVTVEHRRKYGELQRLLADARVERDRACTELRQITYERDAAMAALLEPAPSTEPLQGLPSERSLPSGSEPSAAAERSPSSSFDVGALKLRKQPLKQKPPPSSRPLIGYSLAGEDLSPERLETIRTPESPAKR